MRRPCDPHRFDGQEGPIFFWGQKKQSHGVVAVACVQFTREINKYSRLKTGFCPTGGFGISTQVFALERSAPQFLLTPLANNAVQTFLETQSHEKSLAMAFDRLVTKSDFFHHD